VIIRLVFQESDNDQIARKRELLAMEIKHSSWFAAGPEVQGALLLLSDGAFRLYFYICLNAGRRTGRLSMSYLDLANKLGRSRRSIAAHFDELRREGICRLDTAANQHHRTAIEVCDEFWPYTKVNSSIQPSESGQYLARIKAFLSKRTCVQSTFSAADERTVANLFAGQVRVDLVEQAIALGCCRKYVSLLNGTDSGPIFSFAYFRDVIEEVQDPEIPSGYWNYIMPELEHLEKKWIEERDKAADAKTASAVGLKSTETR
jgi:DNA-binding Lrp family transcriptional regulator